MQKQSIVIVIDDLGKGGAEVLLVGILPELNLRYEVVLVTLKDRCDFTEQELICSKRYVLGFTGKFSIARCVAKLKRIIKRHNPQLVHAHLVYSSLVARVACPKRIPLLYTLHDTLSAGVFNKSKLLTILEKTTIHNKHAVMAVSSEVLLDYEQTIKKVRNAYVLPNYVADVFLQAAQPLKIYKQSDNLKLVAVGNIKAQKNYDYLLAAMDDLKHYPVSLDIYGQGAQDLVDSLQQIITTKQLPVILKGRADNIHAILPNYDVYVLASKHEGFGIAVIEAMAIGLPVVLSDLPVLHNVTFDNALFFDIQDQQSFVNRIREILEDKHDLNALSKRGVELAKEHYTKAAYLKKLFKIYDTVALTR